MTKDFFNAKIIYRNIRNIIVDNFTSPTEILYSSGFFEKVIYNSQVAYFKSKTCKTCKHFKNSNNYCNIIDRFNNVEFGCINHCL